MNHERIRVQPLKFHYGLQIGVFFLIGLLVAADSSALEYGPDFDHDDTGFPLDFKHQQVSCESCHLQAIFVGTPKECISCHSNSGRIKAVAPSSQHILVTGNCDSCHTTNSWEVSRVDHFAVVGSCASCHNGVVAPGKHAGHVQSSNNCENCHNTNRWIGARFDHADVSGNCVSCHNGAIARGQHPTHIPVSGSCEQCHIPNSWDVARVDHFAVVGSCESCHNGVLARGKVPRHIQSGNACDDCHTTTSWSSAVFDHSNIVENCVSCHNGVTATGKNATHISSANSCEDCHSTFAWSPVSRVDHGSVFGNCFSCHNGIVAEGKHPQHISTTNDCELCHNSAGWLPASFVHQSLDFPGEHRQRLECIDCHVANSELVAWQAPALQPDCGGCHANDYRAGEHRKQDNPRANYTASELRDCSGACHIYTDSTLTTIRRTRNSEHRVSDREF